MEDRRIRNLSGFLREQFGRSVHKVGIQGGFDCPNRDGTFSTEGCSFCNPLSGRPHTWRPGATVEEQLELGCEYVSRRFRVDSFLPYFQDYTTTYGEPGVLSSIYRRVLSRPGVVGLALCTRPDCLRPEILDLLEEIASETFLWVEIGVQTSDDGVLEDMNRCHTSLDSEKAFKALHERGILTAAHMILGYPGTSMSTVIEDAGFLRRCGTKAVKLQNFHVVKGTEMERRYREGAFESLSLVAYTELVTAFLEHTDPDTVILRLSGEAPEEMTVAPSWSLRKGRILESIRGEMTRRDTWQGKALGFPRERLDMPASLHG